MLTPTITDWIAQHGYAGIFTLLMLGILGLPVPDETLLVFVGYLVFKANLSFFPAVGAAFAGSVYGITLSYGLGRTGGVALIKKYGRYLHVTDEKIARVHDWLERIGKWALVCGYFVPGVRHFTAVVAGASKMEYSLFALFAYGGALLWSSTFIVIGYFFGREWAKSSATFHHVILMLVGAIVAAVVFFYIVKRRGQRA